MLTFAAPAFLWALLALPLVVLLHRLRVRRKRREVAGLFLWRRAHEVGARRPRFHAGLLLLLQLLAVTGLALALARPQIRTTGPADRVIVIDASASMAAADAATIPARGATAAGDGARPADEATAGETRFDVALALAEELAQDAGRVALVRAGREPVTVLPFTDDLLRIREALAGLRSGDAATDAVGAVTLARDLAGRPAGAGEGAAPASSPAPAADVDGAPAARAAPTEIHWLSDTPPPGEAGIRFHALAGRGVNVGITGFERVAGQAWIRLSSSDPRPVEVPVEVRRDGRPVASIAQLVPARGDVSITLPLGEGEGVVEARIEPPAGDALALDDVAFAGTPSLEVGLEEPFSALERALGAMPGVRTRVGPAVRSLPLDVRVLTEEDVGSLGRAPAGAGAAPAGVATGDAIVLLPPRDAPARAVRVLDWDRSDPLLRFVDLRDLVVAVPEPAPFDEEEGWTTLVRGLPLAPAEPEGAAGEETTDADGEPAADLAARSIPLLQRAEGPGGTVLRFAFHPVRGDLTLRPAFPTMVVNLIDRVRGVARVALGEALPPGATYGGDPVAVAHAPGLYEVGGRIVHASLLDEAETRLPGPADAAAASEPAGAPTLPAPATPAPADPADPASAEGSPAAAAGSASGDLLPLLAGLVGLLLLAEWWGFSGGGLPWRRGPARGADGGPSVRSRARR